MRIFLMHIGHPGHVDVDYTVTRRRSIQEILQNLPPNAPERDYFQHDPDLHEAFSDGTFNCWGVPRRAEPSFAKTEVGDLVLIVPWIGIHDGGIHQIGVVRAKCPVQCFDASKVLWPETPKDRLFPYVFFFDTEVGFRSWFKFLEDVGIAENWHPRGWYRQIDSKRFNQWGGPTGYLEFLRAKCGFKGALAAKPAKSIGSPSVDTPTGGAGFGDPDNNKLVEAAAIKFVTDWYESRQWSVESVERTKCGYDLVCRKGSEEDHVEVKGVAGNQQSFIITIGEANQAKADGLFRLFIVTNALSDVPSYHQYSGQEFLFRFSLSPVQFRAVLRL